MRAPASAVSRIRSAMPYSPSAGPVGAEGVGLDGVAAGLEVGVVHGADDVGAGDVEDLVAALVALEVVSTSRPSRSPADWSIVPIAPSATTTRSRSAVSRSGREESDTRGVYRAVRPTRGCTGRRSRAGRSAALRRSDPHPAPEEPRERQPYSTVLVGTDGSDSSFRAVDKAAAVARDAGATLLLACAYRPMTEREVRDAAAALGGESYKVVGLDAGRGRPARRRRPRPDRRRAGRRHPRDRGRPGRRPGRAGQAPQVDLLVVGNRGLNSLAAGCSDRSRPTSATARRATS